MKFLFTGKDDFKYNRTRILLNGLLSLPDVEVIQYPLNKEDFSKDEFVALSEASDFVYLPPFRHSDCRIVKRLTSTPLIFDPLISKYLTRTIDHGKWWTGPEKYLRDVTAFRASDFILMDTECDRQWIIDKYRLDPDRVFVLPIGVDTSIFNPIDVGANDQFVVGFHGGFIPLQGVDRIVKAAKHLEDDPDIVFDIVGAGSQYKKILKLADRIHVPNVKFRGWVNYDGINDIVNGFDVCLGIFGDSIKTDMVIPNKVYEYAAIKKCIITKDTPAIKEIFEDGKHMVLTDSAPEAIAAKIQEMKQDPNRRQSIAEEGYKVVTSEYDEAGIARKFVAIAKQCKAAGTA